MANFRESLEKKTQYLMNILYKMSNSVDGADRDIHGSPGHVEPARRHGVLQQGLAKHDSRQVKVDSPLNSLKKNYF